MLSYERYSRMYSSRERASSSAVPSKITLESRRMTKLVLASTRSPFSIGRMRLACLSK